jgi:para-nitrobenzyl esterase
VIERRQTVTVAANVGRMRGRVEDGLSIFRGVRFAQPPTGALRFRRPVAVGPWEGVVDAFEFSPICPQPVGSVFDPVPPPQSEDCLALNIWTPGADDARRPVMVWTHGGAYTTGSGSSAVYDGSAFARRDVVLVTLNYRLHIFGFTDLEGRAQGFDGSANAGIADLVMGLEWVRDNIAAFGGDPDNVTIFGESAGAALIGSLLAAPSAQGLFRRAICQSGTGHHVRSREVAARATDHLFTLLHVSDGDTEALQAVPAHRIAELAAQIGIGGLDATTMTSIFADEDPLNSMPFRMTYGDSIIPTHPVHAVAEGASWDVDLIVGSCADEYRLAYLTVGEGTTPEAQRAGGLMTLDFHAKRLGAPVDDILATYRRVDPSMTDTDIRLALTSDLWFVMPGRELADLKSRRNPNTYRYQFAWPTPVFGGVLGSCHVLDVPFVFDTLDQMAALLGNEPPRELATTMQEAWVAFARTGDPGWPAWSDDSREVMRFGEVSETMSDPDRDRIALWRPVFTNLLI